MIYPNSFLSRRTLRAYAAAFISYLMLAGQVAPLALGAAPRLAARTATAAPAAPAPLSAAPMAAPMAFFVPVITATKADSWDDSATPDGKAEPGQTITYTVTITNNGTDPATGVVFTDNVDPNTTLINSSIDVRPITVNDTYNVIGNVGIQPNAAQGLLANDNVFGGMASGPTTSVQGGNVSVNANGSFTYNPPPGFTGTDSFTYTVTSTGGQTDTATATFNVGNGTSTPGSNVIWFINSGAGAGGDGRLSSPFNCLVGPGCFDTVAADEAGDFIFLFSGTYTSGLTLLNTQKLIGQGATDTLASISGFTVPAYSNQLPQTKEDNNALVSPSISGASHGITLGQNNILRGFDVGAVGNGNRKINGAGFGQLTIGKLGEPDVSLSGTGMALFLQNGTIEANSALGSVESTGSSAQGLLLTQITAGTLAIAGTTVSGSTGNGIEVNGSSANINFGNTSVSAGTNGVVLANNAGGTRTFGTLSITGGSGVGFQHLDPDGGGANVGGGTVSVTGATTITNPTGNGIDIDSANANLTFAATTVNKASSGNIGVDLTNNATRVITFSSLAVTTTNGFALNVNNSGTVNVTNAAGSSLTQSGAGGGAASFTNTALGLNFTSVSSDGGGNGILFSTGTGTFVSGTTNLQNNAGIGLQMSSSGVAASFGNTTVNSSAGNAVDLASNTGNITFADLDLTPDANLIGLNATNNSGTITSSSGDIATNGAPAIVITGASAAARTPLALALTDIASTNSTTLGIDLNFVSGNITLPSGGTGSEVNITNPTGIGIQIRNSAAGTLNFGDTVVNGSGGTGVVVGAASNGNAGNITFADLDIAPDSGQRALDVSSNSNTTTATSGTISTTGAVAVNALSSPLALAFDSVSASNATTANPCVSLTTTTGTLTASGGTCTGGTAAAFLVNGGTVGSTYNGTITQSTAAQRAIDIQNKTGGTNAFSGLVTASTTTANAVHLVSNTGATVTFTGGMSLTTTSGVGFNVTGGGTVNATQNNSSILNTVSTSTGTGVNIATPSNIGGSGVTFRSVAVNGAPSGIVLNGTTGAFQVAGDGSTAGGVLDRDGSGGTLNNTTDDAIRLTNASNVTIRQMNLNSPGDTVDPDIADNESTVGEHGIEAIGGSNIIVSATLIDSPAGSGMIARDLTGTNRLNDNSLVTNIDNPATHGLFIRNDTGTLTLFEVNNTDFTNSSSGASAVNFANSGTANMTVEIRNGCIFEALDNQAITGDAGRTAGTTGTVTSIIDGNIFRNGVASTPAGTSGITSENNVAALTANGALHNATISNNTFDNIAEDGRVANTSIIRTQNAGGRLNVVVNGNTIQNINYTAGSGGRHVIGLVDEPVAYSASNFSNLRVENNTATNVTFTATNREFIFIDYRANASNGDVKILGNNWNMPTAAATSEAIEINTRQLNPSTVDLQIDNNGNGTGAISNTSTRFLRIDSEDAATLNTTVTNNRFTNQSGTPGIAIDLSTLDGVAGGAAGAMCVNISGNNVTAAGNAIRLNEAAGAMTVTQASSAAVASANNGAAVTVAGTPTFGQPACALPSNATVGSETSALDSNNGPGGVGVQTDPADAPAPVIKKTRVAPPSSTTAAPAVTAPASAAPVSAAPKSVAPVTAAPKAVRTEAKRSAGTTFRHTAEDSSAPLNPEPAPEPVAQQRRKVPAPVLSDTPSIPNAPGTGGTVSVNIGTLAPGDSVTITFQVVIETPYDGGPNVSNQGTVSGSNFSNVLTDDPAAGGPTDPTLTPINSSNISVNDAQVAEPPTGETDMTFTVSLSTPATAPISVNYATANGTATGGTCGDPGVDYEPTNGTLNFAVGEQVKLVNVSVCSDSVSDDGETLTLTLSGASGVDILDGTATGTITANTPGTVLISELRTFGPGGGNDPADEFVEVYNNSNSPHTVSASDGSAGYGLYAMGADCNATPVLLGTIPNGTVIPASGHYLFSGSAYSLANYGGTGAAAGNLTLAADIPSNGNVAIFSTGSVAAIGSANRLDAVGFGTNVGGLCSLMKEGTTLTAATTNLTALGQYAYFRDMRSAAGGNPKDTNDNSTDFLFADPNGTVAGPDRRLGAAGPENLASPIRRDTSGVGLPLLDGSKSSAAMPNRDRDFTSDPANNSTFGTLTIRRRVTNNTGGNVTRLRFRVVDMTTLPTPPGTSDMRLRTGVVEASVGPVGDPGTCGAAPTPCNVTVQPTTLEQPPTQGIGGGINSTVSAGNITLATPLANGASLNVNFLLGIEKTGTFRFLIIIEALP